MPSFASYVVQPDKTTSMELILNLHLMNEKFRLDFKIFIIFVKVIITDKQKLRIINAATVLTNK